jgi:hypothetical protein
MAHQICVLTAFSEDRLSQSSTVDASVNCLELPADGHFAWDVRWQGLDRLRKNSGPGKKDVPQVTSGAKARRTLNHLRPD